MIDLEEMIRIRWGGAQFELHRDSAMYWNCGYTKKGSSDKVYLRGLDGALILTEAIDAAGLDEDAKHEIVASLMRQLRGTFN
jgi:hypothetical protein